MILVVSYQLKNNFNICQYSGDPCSGVLHGIRIPVTKKEGNRIGLDVKEMKKLSLKSQVSSSFTPNSPFLG